VRRHAYELKISFEQVEQLEAVERYTILSAIDRLWQEHLYGMDSLRNSIGLRAYGQRDPLIEYKAEAFKVFEDLMVNIKTEICHNIFRSASSLMAFERFIHNLPQRTSTSPPALSVRPVQPAQPAQPASDIVSEAAAALDKARTGARRSQGWPQRSLPVWQRQEVQALLREMREVIPPWARTPSVFQGP
jgi:preprotein translocase subunit SecA